MTDRIPTGRIRTDFNPQSIQTGQSHEDGNTFPLGFAKVLRVDPRKRVVDLISLTGKSYIYRDVVLPFPGGGARHFLGSLPEVADIAVIGYTYEESKKSRTALILSWIIPGASAGYDWLMTQFMGQNDLAMTPEIQENLKGIVGRRRHKAMLLEAGNVAGSSSQGADLLLDESVTLMNRRGNEMVLRDQDQAFVLRTLQQFHAGAGFRIYGGMVQRDATFLPTQMLSDGTDWSADRQVDANGIPLEPAELTSSTTDNLGLNVEPVFANLPNLPNFVNPQDILTRGLFVDGDGNAVDGLVVPEVVYGGKSIHRVESTVNGVGTGQTYSEYRIEVAHTTDGTLPVTEQTDGVDIDRLLPAPPSEGIDSTNRSQNAPMVEFVLGTAVGNDPTGDRDSYAHPLKPVVFTKDGKVSAAIVPATADDPTTDHAAFLIRVRNPVDTHAPSAFMAITKGGTLKTYFPGKGSKSHQEYFGSGLNSELGTDDDGHSLSVNAEGTVSLVNWSKPRSADNVGIVVQSLSGAVEIVGGGSSTNGDGVDSIRVMSATGVSIAGASRVKITGPNIVLTESNTISATANTALNLQSGDSTSLVTNTLNASISGAANIIFGGPKNGLPTNGPSRSTTFAANAATGFAGGTVDDYTVVMGDLKQTIYIGSLRTSVGVGGFVVGTANPLEMGSPDFPADGVQLSAGPPLLNQALTLRSPLVGGGAELEANLGNLTLAATKGRAAIAATLGVTINSSNVTITSLSTVVRTPTPNVGGVLTDGVIDSFTGRPFISSGTIGVAGFRVS
jgi:hypothetical protein